MKITLIGPIYPYRGGIAHHTTRLAVALEKAGHSIQIISFRRQYPKWLYPGKTDKDPSRKPLWHPQNTQYVLDPILLNTWLQSIWEINRFSPDRVVIQWWTTFWAPAYSVLTHFLQKRYSVTFIIHNVTPHEEHFWDPYLAKLALQEGSHFIVHTKREQKRLERILPHHCITLTPHPTYDIFKENSISKEQARKLLDLPAGHDHPVALFFGLVRPYKGLRYAIETIAYLHKQNMDVFLLVAGEFWEDENLYRDLIQKLGIAHLVKIDNRYIPNEEIATYFSAADVFLAPYVGGTQSGALRLAMGFGLPLVASNTIFTMSDIPPGYPAQIVPTGDIRALAKAIQAKWNVPHTPAKATLSMANWDTLAKVILRGVQ